MENAQCKTLSRSEIPVFLAVAADHRRKAESSRNLFDRATHHELARKWESRAHAAEWGRI